jgi:mono/diheme cytochrome c family protein
MRISPILLGAAAVTVAATFSVVLHAQQAAVKSVWDGIYTKEQAQRGQAAYKQSCASCHGEALDGIEMAPALAGGEFVDQWAGQTMGDLFERIRATMPRDKPGRLSRDVNADITAYILSFNQFPAGATELSGDTQVLRQIRIDAAKPQ